MKIKALTLWQPWAFLMALEEKKIETRSWGTQYRGMLAIHAAKRKMTKVEKDLLLRWTGQGWLDLDWLEYDEFPLGEIVAVVDLRDCVEIKIFSDEKHFIYNHGAENEVFFGDYTVGRYAWITKMVYAVQYNETYVVNGQRGLWDWEVPTDTKMDLAIKKYQEEKVK